MFKIKLLPSLAEYVAGSEETILNSAIKSDTPLKYSCSTGSCGECRAHLLSGDVDFDDALSVLSGMEKKEGFILTCLAKPLSDCELKADYFPELKGLKASITPAKVDQLQFINDVAILKFRLPPARHLNYVSGQYIDLMCGGIKRSYSIANAPAVGGYVELHIKQVQDGKMSNVIFNDLALNSMVRLEGPKGTFFVRESDKPIIFLATGTGFAPIKSMVESLLLHTPSRKVHIFWGVRSENGFYTHLPIEWSEKYEDVSFTPVVSRPSKNYDGEVGYVQSVLQEKYDDLSGFEVYSCGSPQMIESAKLICEKLKLPREAFYSDAFLPSEKK